MQIDTIVGHAVATVKHASLTGWRLPVIQLLGVDGNPDGEPILAVDSLGAGVGDRVLMCNDGAGCRLLVNSKTSPARWFVMGLCDEGADRNAHR
jgi:ethanolamine utilization protein EutN